MPLADMDILGKVRPALLGPYDEVRGCRAEILPAVRGPKLRPEAIETIGELTRIGTAAVVKRLCAVLP